MTKTPVKLLEISILKVRMAERGLSSATLAALIGFPVRHVRNVISVNHPSWPIRSAINRALGEQLFAKPGRIRKPNRKSHPTP